MRRFLFFVHQPYSLAILRPLQNAIRARGDSAAWFFHGEGAKYLKADEERLYDIRAVKAYRPHAVFVPGNWVPDFIPGIKVQVFHGLETKNPNDHFRIRGLFDLYCTHGPLTTKPFQKLAEAHGHFRVVETGWPKIDPLFQETNSNDLIYQRGDDRQLILYASTFTQSLTSAPLLLNQIDALSQRGERDWLVTLHPKMDPEIVARYRALEGPNLRFVETDDVLHLLRAADVMVSDTSSIVFEFLMLGKPVVTLKNMHPGPHLIDIHSPEELSEALERAFSPDSMRRSAIRDFIDQVHPNRDGLSSERILDAVESVIDAGPAKRKKPVNLLRKLKMRVMLRHFSLS